jgi:predicted dinucleotide-binding enzyme
VAVAAGYEVTIAAAGDPKEIELIIQVLAPGSEPRWTADAVKDADLVILAIPLYRFEAFDPVLLADRLVVDAMNYWPAMDGKRELFEGARHGSSEIVAGRLAQSRVVKALNHIGYHELDAERRPSGSSDRRGLGVAGDDGQAVAEVAEVIERIGYDAVRLDSLRAGRLLQPGGPVFGRTLSRAEFERALHTEAAASGAP